MGKKHRQGRSSSGPFASSGPQHATATSTRETTAEVAFSSSETASLTAPYVPSFRWLRKQRKGLYWITAIAALGALLGFGFGTGYLTGAASEPIELWRLNLGKRVRSTLTYRIATFQKLPWAPLVDLWRRTSDQNYGSQKNLMGDPGHPRVFQVLREAIVRETNGYVHPDLGMLIPAPSGAARGLGMVHDSYDKCQRNCMPGLASEKNQSSGSDMAQHQYQQEEVLLRVPLGIQMTRQKALATLKSLYPADILVRKPLEDLDDAALLVLLLAHERSKSRASRYVAYIASLPTEPSCGYWMKWRPYMNDAAEAMSHYGIGSDMTGWPNELNRAGKYADKIAMGLSQDYGAYVGTPNGIPVLENLQWALCHVASRATAGSDRYGALRLVPMLDMINHDVNAGGFVELLGDERIEKGDFVDASEDDHGAFVVRSLRHGRRKPLRKGQELLANYNVPNYTPLDWFVSLGFVPPELWQRWEKLDAALPRVRRDRSF